MREQAKRQGSLRKWAANGVGRAAATGMAATLYAAIAWATAWAAGETGGSGINPYPPAAVSAARTALVFMGISLMTLLASAGCFILVSFQFNSIG